MLPATDSTLLSLIRGVLVQAPRDLRSFSLRILRILDDLIGSDLGFMAFVDRSGRWLVLRTRAGDLVGAETGKWTAPISRLRIGGEDLAQRDRSFAGYVAYLKKSRRRGIVRGEAFYRQSDFRIESEVCAPIVLDEEVLGVINLESRKSNYYTAGHKHLLEVASQLIAWPVSTLMQREGLRAAVADVPEQVRLRLESVPPGVPLEAHRNAWDSVAGTLAHGLSRTGCTILLSDSDTNDLKARGSFGQMGSDKIITPILSHGKEIGQMWVGPPVRSPKAEIQGYFSDSDQRVIRRAHRRIVNALESNHSDLKRRNSQLENLKQLSRILASTVGLEIRSVLGHCVSKAPSLCGGLTCSVFLWDEGRGAFVLKASKGSLPLGEIDRAKYLPGEGLTGWVGQHGKPLILDSRAPDDLRLIHPDLSWLGKYNETIESDDTLCLRPFLAVPILRDGKSVGVIRIADRRSGFFSESEEQLLNIFACHIASAISYGERYTDKIKLLDELKRIMIVTRQADRLSAANFEDSILEEASKSAADVLHTDVLTLYKFDQTSGDFSMPAVKGIILFPELLRGPTHADDVTWKVLRNGTRYWEDAQRASGLNRSSGSRPNPRFAIREKIASSAGIRLQAGSKSVGVLFLNFRTRQSFDPARREIIETFADQVALSLEISRLNRSVGFLAREEERRRIARDLHDEVKQNLTALGFTLQAVRAALPPGDPLFKHIGDMQTVTSSTETEIKRLIDGLQPALLDQLGLPEAIRSYARTHLEGTGVRVEFDIPGSILRPPIAIETVVFRVIQESINNIQKHSRATQVVLRLRRGKRSISGSVCDNGTGFRVDGRPHGSQGLLGMGARVRALGGKLAIKSEPGSGVDVQFEVPYEEV
jgi:signal transduction histidine kinase